MNNAGTLTLIETLVTANTSNGSGGGLFNDSGTLTLLNSTVSGNAAANLGGGGLLAVSGT